MMKLRWTDVEEIAIALSEKFPRIDPRQILFTDLHDRVCELENFDDDPRRSNEKILEAIQSAWIQDIS